MSNIHTQQQTYTVSPAERSEGFPKPVVGNLGPRIRQSIDKIDSCLRGRTSTSYRTVSPGSVVSPASSFIRVYATIIVQQTKEPSYLSIDG